MSRITFISTMAGFPWGGSEKLWALAAEEALKGGHSVMAQVFDWSVEQDSIKHLKNIGCQIIGRSRDQSQNLWQRILRKVGPLLLLSKIFHNRRWINAISEYNPDIICVSQGNTYELFYDEVLYAFLDRFKGPIILVCQLNSDFYFISDLIRKRARHLFQKAETVVFVSNHNCNLAERQLGIRIGNAVIVHNPVIMTDWSGIPYPVGEKAIFACVARLDVKYKGQDMLFEALGSRPWIDRNWECRLYGGGPDKGYLQTLADLYGIAGRVRFMGHVSDFMTIWKECHLLVMPSRAEGTPLALLEAMVCSRPAVLTDVGGNSEWIEEAERGFLAEASTTKSFGAALERAWNMRDQWKQIGISSHYYVLNHLDQAPGKTLFKIIDSAKLNGFRARKA
jgi:L-malate glycosyltransferase